MLQATQALKDVADPYLNVSEDEDFASIELDKMEVAFHEEVTKMVLNWNDLRYDQDTKVLTLYEGKKLVETIQL